MLLRPREGRQNRFFAGINSAIHKGTTGYQAVLHRLTNWRAAVVVVFLLGLAATVFVYRIVPTSFVPQEDQGYFFVIVQAPPGASLQYTTKVMDRAAAMVSANHDVEGVFSVPGFSFTGSAANQGIIFASLKDISERGGKDHSAFAVLNTTSRPAHEHQ